jgi:orotidine-5'-phosphate decarboxylase
MTRLSAAEHIIMAIDTPNMAEADRLARMASQAGARYVKLGLELSSATSWRFCSDLAANHGLGWVADAKLDDIPNTVAGTVRNIANLPHAPFGITMHTTAGREAMRLAQLEAQDVKMLGVTALTSINDTESLRLFGAAREQKVMQLAREAASAGLAGVVASPLEVGMIKDDEQTHGLFAMIPGIRPAAVSHGDQAAIGTPGMAITAGADLLVIGRPITEAPDPAEAFAAIAAEIGEALNARP